MSYWSTGPSKPDFNLRDAFTAELKKLSIEPPANLRVSYPPSSRRTLYAYWGSGSRKHSTYVEGGGRKERTHAEAVKELAQRYMAYAADDAEARAAEKERRRLAAEKHAAWVAEARAKVKTVLGKETLPTCVTVKSGGVELKLYVEGFFDDGNKVSLYTQTEVTLEDLVKLARGSEGWRESTTSKGDAVDIPNRAVITLEGERNIE